MFGNSGETTFASSFMPEMLDRVPISRDHHLTTDRLNLRPVNKSDVSNFIKLFSDLSVMRFIGIEAGYIPAHSEIEQLHSSAVNAWTIRGYGRWSLFDRKNADFVGFCGFRSENGKPELICALLQPFWHLGLATEAISACIGYGFANFGFTEVNAYTRRKHARARKLMEKLNARFLGYVNFHGVDGAAYSLMPDNAF